MVRERKINKKIIILFTIIPVTAIAIYVLGFFIFMIYQMEKNEPLAAKAQTLLEKEFKDITPLPQGSPQNFLANHKNNHAFVQDTYTTNLGYKEIYDHYNSELLRKGWSLCKEEKVNDWGENWGGKLITYKKEDYVATLEFAGNKKTGWTYALALNWGWKDNCK